MCFSGCCVWRARAWVVGSPALFFLFCVRCRRNAPPKLFRVTLRFLVVGAGARASGCAYRHFKMCVRVPARACLGGGVCSGPHAGIIKAAHGPGHGQGGPLPAGALACTFQTSHAWHRGALSTWCLAPWAPQVAWDTLWGAPRLPGSLLLGRGVPSGV